MIVWEGRQNGVQRSIRKFEVGVNRYVPIMTVLMALWVYGVFSLLYINYTLIKLFKKIFWALSPESLAVKYLPILFNQNQSFHR